MDKNFEDMTEVDLAYQILTENGKDNYIYYRNLIAKILEMKNKVTDESAVISEVYTMINMDSRFQYYGDGKWGLAEWDEGKKRGSARSKVAAEKFDEE